MIELRLSEENFEYDIRGLLMAFYPGEEIHAVYLDRETENGTLPEKDPSGAGHGHSGAEHGHAGGDKCLTVQYEPQNITVSMTGSFGTKEVSSGVCMEDRKACKSELKRLVYRLLSEETKKTLPWGTLTGIRPTKIPMAMLEEGMDEDAIAAVMEKEYLTREKKTRLSIEIAEREKEVLKPIDYQDGYSLYIGIPFCPTTCLYCSFTSYPVQKWMPRMHEYLDALEREIDYTAEAFRGKKLNTIYIGGGTPTTLLPDQMERLLSKVEASFDLSHLKEWTVEAGRPDSVNADKLEVLRKHPVSRISINPQTMKAETLKLIGRRHTPEQIREAFYLAREKGFDNINMDLILGLPEETLSDVRGTMEALYEMDPDSITVHSLAIKRAARLNTMWEKYAHMRFENTDEGMDLTAEYCRRLGLLPYYLYRQKNMAGNFENVGYAREGKAGIYNILIMEELQTIVALGAGSTTKAVFADGRIERCDNVKDIDQYLSRISEMIDRKRKLLS